MTIDEYRDEIKMKLTGGVLKLEIADDTLDKIINSSLREIQRYIDTTKIITIPYSACIDLTEYNVYTVTAVYRAESYMGNASSGEASYADPVYLSAWQFLGGGSYGSTSIENFGLNYAAYATTQQIRNTLSTDLARYFDKSTNKLYINNTFGGITNITIEYIPEYKDVSEIDSIFWIDKLMRLAVANTKVVVGRVRSRYKQSNALWEQDGDTLLQEGNTELTELRADLQSSAMLAYPLD